MPRRLVPVFASAAVVGLSSLSIALLPASAANAAAALTVTASPTHGIPGASIDLTISTTECTTEAVQVTGAYVDVNGEDATTDPVDATPGEGAWTATVTIPADAARTSLSDEPVTYTASADCGAASPSPSPSPSASPSLPPQGLRAAAAGAVPLTTGAAKVTVDDLPEAVLTLSPASVKPGAKVSYSVTGCIGGIADFYLEDSDGNDTDITEDTVTSQPAKHAYKGTFTVPANAVTGDAAVFLECAQAASTGANLSLGSGSVVVTPGPVATPVTARPSFTG